MPKGAFHRTGSAVAFTATNVAAETGADERPLIAVSTRNFNTAYFFALQRSSGQLKTCLAHGKMFRLSANGMLLKEDENFTCQARLFVCIFHDRLLA